MACDCIRIAEVSDENIDDLCGLCIPPERVDDPNFVKGVELKKIWVKDMKRRWGSVAKVAYFENTPAGLIQYVPIPNEKVVRVLCIFVPRKEHWRKGIGKLLLKSLIEDMGEPKGWFEDELPSAIVTKTFSGEKPGQYSAQNFFENMGFKQSGEDPNLLYYPLKRDFVYVPIESEEPKYVSQDEDKGKVVIIYGPSFCPWSYFFLKISGQEIEKNIPKVRIRWINSLEEPHEAEKRGISEGIIANAIPIKTFLLEDKEAFLKEIINAFSENR